MTSRQFHGWKLVTTLRHSLSLSTHQQRCDKMVSFCEHQIYLLFLLLVKFYGSGKSEIYSPVQRTLQCVFTMCHFKLRHEPETPTFISERDIRQNDFRTPRWLSTVFVFQNFEMMLRFQSSDVTEIKSKGFYASSVTLL